MKKIITLLSLCMIGFMALVSCNITRNVTQIETDDMYFMSSDRIETEELNLYGDLIENNISKNRWFIGPTFNLVNFYDPFFPRFGWTGIYDPFFPRFGWTVGVAWNLNVYNRQIIRRPRLTRGSTLIFSNRSRLDVATRPTNTRSAARRVALTNRTIRRGSVSSRENFRSIQRNYNSARPIIPSSKTRQSSIINRTAPTKRTPSYSEPSKRSGSGGKRVGGGASSGGLRRGSGRN